MVNQSVLVLNSSYTPLYVTTVWKAINLLFRDKAEIVDVGSDAYATHDLTSWEEVSYYKSELEKDFNYLRGGNDYVLGVPKVIRLVKYVRHNMDLHLTRKNIFLRDDNTCQYCGKHKPITELNIDHVVPKSQGGKNLWTNLVCSCIPCNEKKGPRTPKEAGMKLIRQPKKPSQYLMFKNYIKRMDEEPFKDWKTFFPDDFISEAYWNTELQE